MASIHLDHVHKKYGKFTAIGDLTLTIADKELLVLLGPSGCGKTTTINIIAGIEDLTSGKIYFNETDATNWPANKRSVSMVFQSSLLYPHLTARKNIEMSLKHTAMSKEEKIKRTIEMVRLLRVESLIDKYPYEMSGGERQRVATAKALVRSPSVFLLDEPLGSVDAAMREDLRVEIVVLQKKLGVTTIFVTHDQTEAMTIGDRIAVMSEDRLCQVDSPDRIYNMPRNTFVAQFIGSPSMNFFQGQIKPSGGSFAFKFPGGTIDLPKKFIKYVDKLSDMNSVTLGIRPQYVNLVETRTPNTIDGQIYGIERLGKETVFTIESQNKNKIKAVQPPSYKYQLQDRVNITIQSENVYLFDSKTGNNIALET